MSSAARVTRPPAPPAPAVEAFGRPVRRFTVGEYHKLMEVGILKEGDPYELLNGVITLKMPQNSPHSNSSTRLERRLVRLLPDALVMRVAKPVIIRGSDSEPEPDVAIVVGPIERYDTGQPSPKDVVLVAEVSDTSLAYDQGEKLGIYAAARIPVYWILNIPDRRVEVYTHPRGGKSPTYRERVDYATGDDVPFVVGGAELGRIPVNDLLP